jgi:carbohydrate kinase (thermoresistant glucokinase family)
MARNIPLTDSDRWDWLAHIRGAVMDRLLSSDAKAVTVTCSALRTVYRDELRRLNHLFDFPVTVSFLLLTINDKALLTERMNRRSATEQHYMKSSMVASQLDLLEIPVDEDDVVMLDSSRPRDEVLGDVVQTVQNVLKS